MSRTRVLAALSLLLAVALTGCGGDDGGEVASGGGNTTPAGKASATSTLSADERNVKYAECLRKNGVDVDDPKPGQPGVRFTFGPGSDRKAMEKAQEACRKWSPQANQSPGEQQKRQENQQKFAECMRKNGVDDFPDPKPGEPIKVNKKLADDPDFESAQKTCQDKLSGKGGN